LIKKAGSSKPAFFTLRNNEKIAALLKQNQEDENYPFLLALFEALSGFIFCVFSLTSSLMCVAVGHLPLSHLLAGSGYTLQYFAAWYSMIFPHSVHLSIITWQLPPK